MKIRNILLEAKKRRWKGLNNHIIEIQPNRLGFGTGSGKYRINIKDDNEIWTIKVGPNSTKYYIYLGISPNAKKIGFQIQPNKINSGIDGHKLFNKIKRLTDTFNKQIIYPKKNTVNEDFIDELIKLNTNLFDEINKAVIDLKENFK